MYRQRCGLKFSLIAISEQSHKTWFQTVFLTIYQPPHQIKILNMVISLECCKPHKVTCYPKKCDINNNVKLFLTVYHRIYCGKFLMLFNQMSHYKMKCIRVQDILLQISDTIQWDVVLQKQVHSNSSYLWYSNALANVMRCLDLIMS